MFRRIHPGGPEGSQVRNTPVGGIHLRGDLGVRGDAESIPETFHGPPDLLRREDRRRTPPEIDRIERPEGAPVKSHLAVQGFQETGDLPLLVREGVETAVGALGAAEGDVDVKARGHGMRAQSVSDFRTARKALWGMLTFPTIFMRFLPFFCFSSSFRFRVMSPP